MIKELVTDEGEYTKMIKELLTDVGAELKSDNRSTFNVGNRPHFPPMVVCSGIHPEDKQSLNAVLGDFWSSRINNNIVIYSYRAENGDITFYNDDGTLIEKSVVLKRMDEVSKISDLFSSVNQWKLFNIIDVRDINSFEEFLAFYHAEGSFVSIIDEIGCDTMAIIILDEARQTSKKDLVRQVRAHLSKEENLRYKSNIFLSNRARMGKSFTYDEIYAVAASIILLADNDAVSEYDDEDFRIRNLHLYNAQHPYPLTVSLKSMVKPYESILLCVIDKVLSRAKMEVRQNRVLNQNELYKILEIENGRIKIIEEHLAEAETKLSEEEWFENMIRGMSLKKPIIFNPVDYSRFGNISGNLNIANYRKLIYSCALSIFNSNEFQNVLTHYLSTILNKFTLKDANEDNQSEIRNVFRSLNNRSDDLSVNMPVSDYVVKDVMNVLRNQMVYPYFEKKLVAVFSEEKYKTAKKMIEEISSEVEKLIPIEGFDEIVQDYANRVPAFLETTSGKDLLNSLLSLSNGQNNIKGLLKKILIEADKYANNAFNVPFIYKWATMLAAKGVILKNTLLDVKNEDVMLRGNYAIKELLTVFMLHTTNRNGTNETELYKQLSESFSDMQNVQFFNSGNDDAITSIKLYLCSGTDLVSGI